MKIGPIHHDRDAALGRRLPVTRARADYSVGDSLTLQTRRPDLSW